MPHPGPALGIDFGERRLGVAVSDAERLIATGLDTIDRKKRDALDALAEVIARKRVTAIVLGYPARTDGVEKAGGKTEAVDDFAAALRERFGLPVHLEDESYSSARAADAIRLRKPSRRPKTARDFARGKAEIDRVAACVILQDWLDRENAP